MVRGESSRNWIDLQQMTLRQKRPMKSRDHTKKTDRPPSGAAGELKNVPSAPQDTCNFDGIPPVVRTPLRGQRQTAGHESNGLHPVQFNAQTMAAILDRIEAKIDALPTQTESPFDSCYPTRNPAQREHTITELKDSKAKAASPPASTTEHLEKKTFVPKPAEYDPEGSKKARDDFHAWANSLPVRK